jgi:hypothetical protein
LRRAKPAFIESMDRSPWAEDARIDAMDRLYAAAPATAPAGLMLTRRPGTYVLSFFAFSAASRRHS